MNSEEWEILTNLYGSVKIPIEVKVRVPLENSPTEGKIVNGKWVSNQDYKKKDVIYDFSPQYCSECKEEEELNYSSGVIFVLKKIPAESSNEVIEIHSDGSPARPKKRLRVSPSSKRQKNRERVQLLIQPSLSVRDLKESV